MNSKISSFASNFLWLIHHDIIWNKYLFSCNLHFLLNVNYSIFLFVCYLEWIQNLSLHWPPKCKHQLSNKHFSYLIISGMLAIVIYRGWYLIIEMKENKCHRLQRIIKWNLLEYQGDTISYQLMSILCNHQFLNWL